MVETERSSRVLLASYFRSLLFFFFLNPQQSNRIDHFSLATIIQQHYYYTYAY